MTEGGEGQEGLAWNGTVGWEGGEGGMIVTKNGEGVSVEWCCLLGRG